MKAKAGMNVEIKKCVFVDFNSFSPIESIRVCVYKEAASSWCVVDQDSFLNSRQGFGVCVCVCICVCVCVFACARSHTNPAPAGGHVTQWAIWLRPPRNIWDVTCSVTAATVFPLNNSSEQEVDGVHFLSTHFQFQGRKKLLAATKSHF